MVKDFILLTDERVPFCPVGNSSTEFTSGFHASFALVHCGVIIGVGFGKMYENVIIWRQGRLVRRLWILHYNLFFSLKQANSRNKQIQVYEKQHNYNDELWINKNSRAQLAFETNKNNQQFNVILWTLKCHKVLLCRIQRCTSIVHSLSSLANVLVWLNFPLFVSNFLQLPHLTFPTCFSFL